MILMSVLVTIWGLRLTYNFSRRGIKNASVLPEPVLAAPEIKEINPTQNQHNLGSKSKL